MLHTPELIQAKVQTLPDFHYNESAQVPSQQKQSEPQVQQMTLPAKQHSEPRNYQVIQHQFVPAELPSKNPSSPLRQASLQQQKIQNLPEIDEEEKVLQINEVPEDKASTQPVNERMVVDEGGVIDSPKKEYPTSVNADTQMATNLITLLPLQLTNEITEK